MLFAIGAALFCVALAGSSLTARAATILTEAGTTLMFDTMPDVGDFSTATIAGAGGDIVDAAAMDARVAMITASQINTALAASATAGGSGTNALARYNTTELYVSTRPTGVALTPLMATLQNGAGGRVTSLAIDYAFGEYAEQPEEPELDGHRVYFSLDGTTWTNIPSLSGVGTPGTLMAAVNVGSWEQGAPLYLLWADDNGPATDGGFTIDNLRLVPTVEPIVIGRNLVYNRSHTVGGAPNGSLSTSGNYFLEGNTPTAFAATDVANFSQDGSATINVPADITTGGVVVSHTTGTYTIGGAGKIKGPFTKSNAGTVVFTSTNDFNRSTITGGTVETQAGALGAGPVAISGSALWRVTTTAQNHNGLLSIGTGGATVQTDADLTATGVDGAGLLTKTGTGSLIFRGGGSGTGGINVQAGRLALAGAVGGAGQTITLNGNPLDFVNTADFTFSDAVTARTINFGSSGVSVAVTAPGNPANPGTVGVILGDNTLVGSGTITKAGNGALRVRGDHPNLTSNWVVAAGTLESGAFPTALGTGTVTVNGPAAGETIVPTLAGQNTTVANAVTLNGGNLGTRSGDLTDFTGPVNVNVASGVALHSFTTPTNAQSIEISGVLSGSANLALNSAVNTAAGTKAFILTNPANTYTGTMTVGAGGGLAGTGNTRGAVNVAALGTLSPGADIAVPTFGPGVFSIGGNLTLEPGAVFSADISGADPAPTAGTDYDQVVVGTGTGATSTGAVNLGGSDLVLTIGTGALDLNDLFFLIINDGNDPVAGTFNNLPDGSVVAAGTDLFVVSYDANSTTGTFVGGNDVALMFVPEPGSGALVLLGTALLLRRQRRRVNA